MPDQSGKNNAPFATAAGKPITPDAGATPTDLIASGGKGSDAAKGGDQRGLIADRKQIDPNDPNRPPQPPTPVHLQNRPQTPGSAAQRVNPDSIANGGPGPVTPTQQPTGAGSVGNARLPFKGMR